MQNWSNRQPMTEQSKNLNVIGISGSLRPGSYTRMALEIAMQGAEEIGAQTRILDLGDYDLPLVDGRDTPYPEGVQRLRADVQAADGIIIGTPEYHSGMSGVLKNAIDLMGFDEFGGKMLGLIGVSGGTMGGIHALNSLRTIGRALHAWVIPQQVAIPQGWKAFDEEGNLKNEQYRDRLLEVGRQVARFAYMHSSEQVQEFLEMWEQAPSNPGG
jgi:NAD(P)H-dependent FMN reductase